MFEALYSWFRYRIMPPSFFARNRLWLERSGSFRQVWIRFGVVFRNEKWTNFEIRNLQPSFVSNIRNFFSFFLFFSLVFILFFFFLQTYMGEGNSNLVFFSIWSFLDSNDYISLFSVWISNFLISIFFELFYIFQMFNWALISSPINTRFYLNASSSKIYTLYTQYRNVNSQPSSFQTFFDPSPFVTIPVTQNLINQYYNYITKTKSFQSNLSNPPIFIDNGWNKSWTNFNSWEKENLLTHDFILNMSDNFYQNKHAFFFVNKSLQVELPFFSFIHLPVRVFLFYHNLILQIWKSETWWYRYSPAARTFMNTINFHASLKSLFFFSPGHNNTISVPWHPNKAYPINFFFKYLDPSLFWYLKRFSFFEGHVLRTEYKRELDVNSKLFSPLFPLSPAYLLFNSFFTHFESPFLPFINNYEKYNSYTFFMDGKENSLFNEDWLESLHYLTIQKRFYKSWLKSNFKTNSSFVSIPFNSQTNFFQLPKPITPRFGLFLRCFEINQLDNTLGNKPRVR